MVFDFERALGQSAAVVELTEGSKVDDCRQPEIAELVAVRVVETRQPVGTKEAAPPDPGAVGGRVAAEVSKVEASRQGELAGRVVQSLGHSNGDYFSDMNGV